MACAVNALEIAMEKCTHFSKQVKESQRYLDADDSNVMAVLSDLERIVAHYESRRRGLMKELRVLPASIPIPNAVLALDFATVSLCLHPCHFWWWFIFLIVIYAADFERVPRNPFLFGRWVRDCHE
jgi:hypothetical protein